MARSDQDAPSGPVVSVRTVLAAVCLILLVAAVVLSGRALAGEDFAAGLYLGAILTAASADKLRRLELVGAGVFAAAAAAGAALAAPHLPAVLLVLVVASLGQAWFNTRAAGAVSITPALVALFGLVRTDPAPGLIGAGIVIGMAVMLGVTLVVKVPRSATAVPTGSAIVHGLLLALGCTAAIGIAAWTGAARVHWAALALCLVFLPWRGSTAQVVGFAALTTIGATAAVLIGWLAPTWLILALVALGAVATVVFALAPDARRYLLALTPTVILVTGIAGAEETIGQIGAERVIAVLVAGAVATGLLALWGWWPGHRAMGGTARSAEPAPSPPR